MSRTSTCGMCIGHFMGDGEGGLDKIIGWRYTTLIVRSVVRCFFGAVPGGNSASMRCEASEVF